MGTSVLCLRSSVFGPLSSVFSDYVHGSTDLIKLSELPSHPFVIFIINSAVNNLTALLKI